MIRPARTLTAILASAALGIATFGVAAASAEEPTSPPPGGTCTAPSGDAGVKPFLPTANPGGFHGTSEGHVYVRIPNGEGKQSQWDRLFSYVGGENAHQIASDLSSVLDKAERRFDRNGSGDTSDTSDNKHFRTQKFRNGYGVVSNGGGVVGVYDTEEKANAVANALEEEMEKQTEEHGDSADPCVDNTPFDPQSEGRY